MSILSLVRRLFPLLALAVFPLGSAYATLTVYPMPPEETPSPDYTVQVRRLATPSTPALTVPVYGSFQFDKTSKETEWGRPVSPLGFCSLDTDEPVEIIVHLSAALAATGIDTSRVTVRPLALGIHPRVVDGEVRFRVDRWPCQISVEPGGGLRHPLHVFVNPIERDRPSPYAPNTLYFGPGYHEIDETTVADGQTVYVAGGAVVELKPLADAERGVSREKMYGLTTYAGGTLFDLRGRKNVTMRGRGILSCRKALLAGQRGKFLDAGWCKNLHIEGLIFRESGNSGPHIVNSDGVDIDNIKVLCPYVNGDGIIIGGTSNATVENCFAHNADDSLEVKIWIPMQNVTFRNCIVWNDLGGSLGLMSESNAASSNITFRDCTVLHSTDDESASPVVGLKLDGAGAASHYLFENIVVEEVTGPHRPALKVFNNWTDWSRHGADYPAHPYRQGDGTPHTPTRGAIADVTFRNIRVLEAANTDVVLMADSPASPLRGITFEKVTIDGSPLKFGDTRLKTNGGVTEISFP